MQTYPKPIMPSIVFIESDIENEIYRSAMSEKQKEAFIHLLGYFTEEELTELRTIL